MISWGLVSTCMMLVKGAPSFYALRFLLGVAEAGFFPGMILYLTYWIPAAERARAFALFLTSTSLAGVIGGPLSGALFRLEGLHGVKGWQWLFLMEGIPAVALGCVTLIYLVDRPDQAKWLAATDRDWLSGVMDKENENKRLSHGCWMLRQALTHPKVWRLCLLYFAIVISFYGVAFWLPQVVKSFSGLDNTTVASLSALPYVAASIAMVFVANHSDRTGERRWHVAAPAFAGALGEARRGGLFSPTPVALACVRFDLRRRVGYLEHARSVLEFADGFSKRNRGSRRRGVDQFHRQHRRLCRTVCCRVRPADNPEFH